MKVYSLFILITVIFECFNWKLEKSVDRWPDGFEIDRYVGLFRFGDWLVKVDQKSVSSYRDNKESDSLLLGISNISFMGVLSNRHSKEKLFIQSKEDKVCVEFSLNHKGRIKQRRYDCEFALYSNMVIKNDLIIVQDKDSINLYHKSKQAVKLLNQYPIDKEEEILLLSSHNQNKYLTTTKSIYMLQSRWGSITKTIAFGYKIDKADSFTVGKGTYLSTFSNQEKRLTIYKLSKNVGFEELITLMYKGNPIYSNHSHFITETGQYYLIYNINSIIKDRASTVIKIRSISDSSILSLQTNEKQTKLSFSAYNREIGIINFSIQSEDQNNTLLTPTLIKILIIPILLLLYALYLLFHKIQYLNSPTVAKQLSHYMLFKQTKRKLLNKKIN